MNSISNGWESTKQAETHYFVVVPQGRTKMAEVGKLAASIISTQWKSSHYQ